MYRDQEKEETFFVCDGSCFSN